MSRRATPSRRCLVRIITGLAVLLFVGGAPAWTQQAPVRTDAQPQDALVVLQLGACEGHCPVYKLVVFADATTIFEGRHYVVKSGVVRGKMTRDELGGILADAGTLHFFDLKARYAPGETAGGECLTPRSDAPTAILTISANGRTHTVVHFRGCTGADAQRLTQLEDRIVALARISKFIR